MDSVTWAMTKSNSYMRSYQANAMVTKYKNRVTPIDITAANKTKMVWDFLAMLDTGNWQEHKGDEINVLKSSFMPGKEPYEILMEPELLQQMFYRELRGCRIEPTGKQSNVRWGVKDGTRNHTTGRILHDDLVMSAALAVFETSTLPIRNHIEGLTEHYEKLQKFTNAECAGKWDQIGDKNRQ